MLLKDVLSDVSEIRLQQAVPRTQASLPPIAVRSFGMTLTLQVTSDPFLRDDSLWRVRSIYEPALATQTLAATGVALDIGAGFGQFAIPFALTNRGWTVWTFEPDPEAYAALCRNIGTHQATNVVAVNAAVAGGSGIGNLSQIGSVLAGADSRGPEQALALSRLLKALPRQGFRRHRQHRGIIEIGAATSEEFEACEFPCLPAEALPGLNPSLLKLTAPCAEVAILEGLITAPLDHVIGESWAHVPSHLVYGHAAGRRQTWIPRAGDPLLRLRRVMPLTDNRGGLDIVVAMYNSRTWIRECVDALLADGNPEVRILVVDDGSTDGSGDLVAAAYGGHERVVLLGKENGGCASARNYGRLNSDASHIAFVDADDVAGPGLFAGLLELARHTGAEIVQGGFDLLVENAEGGSHLEPSYEAGLSEFIHAHRHPLGERTCHLIAASLLTQGQPSIWRRVYRRDFLDNRKIWFPEHIRAFDDQIFQLLTLQQVENVPTLDGVHYHYRQHAAQDIRAGDERLFYSLEMFRLVLKRGVSEGWNDFRPVLSSFVKTVTWCWGVMRADLHPAFERGAAELWAYARVTLDPSAFDGLPDDGFPPPDFPFHVRSYCEKLRALDRGYGAVYLDSIDMHPAMVALHSGGNRA